MDPPTFTRILLMLLRWTHKNTLWGQNKWMKLCGPEEYDLNKEMKFQQRSEPNIDKFQWSTRVLLFSHGWFSHPLHIIHAYVSMISGSLAENNTYTVQWERPGVAEVFGWHGPVTVCAVKMFQWRTWKEYLPLQFQLQTTPEFALK